MEFSTLGIEKIKADAIVNAANGIGFMGGVIGRWIKTKGVAECLHYETKGKLEKEAKKVAKKEKPKLGEVYVTESFGLDATWVFHAVTMKYPGMRSKYETVEKCLDQVLMEAKKRGCRSVALPALGTGIGGLDIKEVATIYKRKIKDIKDITFIISDPSGKFIECLKEK